MALTEQKRLYAEARLAGLNQRQAAIAAGCPAKTASQAASRYEKDPHIKAAIGRVVKVAAAQPQVEPKPTAKAPDGDPNPYIPAQAADPLEFFKGVMNDLEAEPKLRLDAAKALAAFTIARPGEVGKKDAKKDAAKVAASGRFGSPVPPRLVVNNG